MKKILSTHIFFLSSLLWHGCVHPRDNHLDPLLESGMPKQWEALEEASIPRWFGNPTATQLEEVIVEAMRLGLGERGGREAELLAQVPSWSRNELLLAVFAVLIAEL